MPQAAFKSGTQDPSSVATDGVAGTVFAKRSAPFAIYQKQDSGSSTNWSILSASAAYNVVTTQVAAYAANINDAVPCDATGGSFAVTLPTAVGQSGKSILVLKTDASTNTIPLNTTGGETVGNRASGDVACRMLGDYVQVVSDGANWLIANIKETQYMLAANTELYSTIGAAFNYGLLATSIPLTYGVWELDGQLGINCSDGVAPGIVGNSGFYAADGNNDAVQPTALGAEVVFGNPLFTNDWGTAVFYNNTINPGNNSQWATGNNKIVVSLTANKTIYLVPQIDFSAANSAEVKTIFTARRL